MYNKSYAKISTLRPQFQKETGGKKKEKSIMVSSSKKGNCTRAFHAYFFRNTVQDGAGIPSILTIPPREIKSYTILDISWIGFATLSLKANDYHSAYLWNSGESVHARVYTCSKFVPFETNAEKWYEKWSNYATYCKDPYSPPLRPPRVSAPLEKLSLHRREELFRLWNNWLFSLSLSFLSSFFFVFFSRMKMTMYRVDISVITLWLHAKLLLYLAFNGRERKNCNDSSSESLSETGGKWKINECVDVFVCLCFYGHG